MNILLEERKLNRSEMMTESDFWVNYSFSVRPVLFQCFLYIYHYSIYYYFELVFIFYIVSFLILQSFLIFLLI